MIRGQYHPRAGVFRRAPFAPPQRGGAHSRIRPRSSRQSKRPRDTVPARPSECARSVHPIAETPVLAGISCLAPARGMGFEDNRRPERAWFSACELEFGRRERRPTLSETTSLGSSSVSENPHPETGLR